MHDNGFIARLLIGGFILLIGLNLLLNQMGLSFIGFSIFSLWPLLLILLSIWLLIQRRFSGALLFGMLGVAFILADIFGFSVFAVLWPVLIIFIGLSILFRPKHNFGWESRNPSKVNRDSINESIFFSATDLVIASDNFIGGKIDGVFGGFKVDLRQVKLAPNGAMLEINGIFGGGEVILPSDIKIEVETVSVVGGVSNHVVSRSTAGDPVLKVKAVAVFGGIELKN